MAATNIPKLQLLSDTYLDGKYTDESSLSKALISKSDQLSIVLTHLAGKEDKRFPMNAMTEGRNFTKVINSNEYDWPVMSRVTKVEHCTENLYGSSDKPGIGFTPFKAVFASRWLTEQYVITSENGYQCRIEDVSEEGTRYVYTLRLLTTEPGAFLPPSELNAKTKWGQLFAPVATSGSHGNESHFVTPGRVTNQVTTFRKSYAYEGEQNRVVNIVLNTKEGKESYWWPFAEWQFFLQFKIESEVLDVYSKYNRDANGQIHLKDKNGKPIPIGAGILEQIPNYSTYSELSANKIKNVVRDALFGASDASKMNIVLFTGLGGLEEFDNAMKASGLFSIVGQDLGEKFVSGGPRNLAIGGFFNTYRHIDGHEITVRHLPLFDTGPVAEVSRKHPRTGLPIESYRMVFLDMSQYDGEPNVYHIHTKNRNLIRWAVAGATIPSGFVGNDLRANDKDGSSVHFLRTSGKCIRRATNCLHMECVMS